MKSIRLRSPSKINLFLRVLGKRNDGYHQIETLFQEIDLADEILLKQTGRGTSLRVYGAPEIETEDNIVFKALRWLEKLSGRKFDVEIELHKNVPIGAGLGGGSSNAAAIILGIRELYDLDWLDVDAIGPLTSTIGADVPFFFRGGTAIGEGLGEKLTPVFIEQPDQILLVNPGFPVSTARIFAQFSKTLTGEMRPGILQGLYGERRDVRSFLYNELQTIAEREHPSILSVMDALRNLGVENPLMSGSGPTVFGFIDRKIQDAQFSDFPKSWRVILTKPVKHGVTIN